jgi:hypothetical protein
LSGNFAPTLKLYRQNAKQHSEGLGDGDFFGMIAFSSSTRKILESMRRDNDHAAKLVKAQGIAGVQAFMPNSLSRALVLERVNMQTVNTNTSAGDLLN